MTMLDRMRRYRSVLKWTLLLVVISFILLYIPSFLQTQGVGAAPRETVARIEGETITAGEFSRLYLGQLQAAQASGNVSADVLRQLGFDRQILNQLVEERVAAAEAARLGIVATDAEVRERILHLPGLQENGQFIGEERYRALLRAQRPPLTHTEFEESLRRSIAIEKLQASLSEWITVPDPEVDAEYRRRNEQVKLEVVSYSATSYRPDVSTTEPEMQAFFDKKKDTYKFGERRKVKFLPISVQSIRTSLNISAQDIERAYNANIQQYQSPMQVRASHILLKLEDKDEAAVRKQAEDLLAQAKGGADFAQLATKFSEDEGTKDKGGDLDFFTSGRMVPAFETAAFAMEPGQISDVVKTDFGFHIIKVTDKRGGVTQPLAEVQAQITEQLKWEKAQEQAQQTANRLTPLIKTSADLDTVGKANGLTAQESTYFAASEPIGGLGAAPEAAAQAFSLAQGAVSGAVRTADGFAFLTVIDIQAPRVPNFDEVKDKVRDDLIGEKAATFAKERAAAAAPTLKSAANFVDAAKKLGTEAQTTDMIARGAAVPGIGVSPQIEAVAFKLPVGSVSDPVETPNGTAIFRVVERKDITPADVAANRDTLRRELQGQRRQSFFSSYMEKAKQRMKITINDETVQRITAL